MESRVEIILDVQGTRFYLDTQGIETIPLTFNIADIKDISTTNGSFSKSIVVPETANNRNVFNNISNLNSVSSFNPNLRNRCYILVDTQLVIDGYFQLKSITINKSKDLNQMTLIVFADSNDFYTVLGEQYIEDIDMSIYDHEWNNANIIASWNKEYTYGYNYPLIDYGYDWTLDGINGNNQVNGVTGSGEVLTGQMYPAIYTRLIWDRIFQDAGFSWKSNSFTQSTVIDNTIIPFNNKDILISNAYKESRLFRIGINPIQYIHNNISFAFTYNSTPYQQPLTAGGGYVDFPVHRLDFNDETTPNGDPNNLWNSTLFEYTNTDSFPVCQRFGFSLVIDQLFYYAADNPPYIQLKRSMNPNTGLVVPGGYDQQTNDLVVNTSYYSVATSSGWTETTPGSYGVFGSFQTLTNNFYSPMTTYFPGEKVWIEYNFAFGGNGDYDFVDFGGGIISSGNTMSRVGTHSFIFNDLSNIAIPNQPISLTSCIPKKIKKRDFIMSIIKMFNLIVEPDKNQAKLLNIETRDYYYSVGAIKDWSKKIDLNDDIDDEILGDLQDKRTIFKYKDDKDYLNIDYTDLTNESYGQYNDVAESEFVINDNIIEIIFSPTPIESLIGSVYTGGTSNIIIPKIGIVNNNVFQYAASNIRILQRKQVTLGSSDYWIFNSGIMTSYPYAGHFDDPLNPTWDINFGQTRFLYYPSIVTTNNNLFTRYWKRMMDEITDRDSRIVTCSIYLTPEDIVAFKFNDAIFLDFGDGGQYYKVNKIDSYDPTQICTCRVEFIKTKDASIPIPIPIYTVPVTDGLVHPTGNYNQHRMMLTTNAGVDPSNTIAAANVYVAGLQNEVVSPYNMVLGHANLISKRGSLIVGDFNNNTGEKNLIIGDNNLVTANKVVILGDNMKVSTPNTINFANVVVFNTNFITAGRDEVLSPFSDNSVINYISGSRDAVRNLGSYTNINIISAGRNSIL